MEAGSRVRLMDVWVDVRDPRQAKKVEHDLVEMLVVAVCAVLSGADGFVEIEACAKEKLDWLRRYLKLEAGIPCHDTFGRVFAAINRGEFGGAFLRWVGQVVTDVEAGGSCGDRWQDLRRRSLLSQQPPSGRRTNQSGRSPALACREQSALVHGCRATRRATG